MNKYIFSSCQPNTVHILATEKYGALGILYNFHIGVG